MKRNLNEELHEMRKTGSAEVMCSATRKRCTCFTRGNVECSRQHIEYMASTTEIPRRNEEVYLKRRKRGNNGTRLI